MKTIIRDSIWGDVSLSAPELALIDTQDFQRLRRVRQLGFADLVFPGATHTRFEHSLGVFHLATLAVESLRKDPLWPNLPPHETKSMLAAALLHDVGHYPFSHTLEELSGLGFLSHTALAADRILNGEISDVLTNVWQVAPESVASFIVGDQKLSESQKLLSPIIDSGLDADKLDYLVRDARGANVPYGVVDVQRLLHSLAISLNGEELSLAVKRKGVPALQSLVFAKHLMYSVVYWHHACRSAAVMLLRAVTDAVDRQQASINQIAVSDDAGLLTILQAAGGTSAQITTRLNRRELYKRGAEFDPSREEFKLLEDICSEVSSRRKAESLWADALGVSEGDILADVQTPISITVDIDVLDNQETGDFDDTSLLARADLDRLQNGARRARIFATDSELATKVSKNTEKLIGLI